MKSILDSNSLPWGPGNSHKSSLENELRKLRSHASKCAGDNEAVTSLNGTILCRGEKIPYEYDPLSKEAN